MQIVGNKESRQGKGASTVSLTSLKSGETAVLQRLDLPETVAHRLMILGFVPGAEVEYSCSAPGGDPKVFRVGGAEVALRSETARHIEIALRD
jgi:ferrous iron transport protein A